MVRTKHIAWLMGVLIGGMALSGCQRKETFSAQQVAVLQQQGFIQGNDGWSFGMSEKVLFGNNQFVLRPESQAHVAEIGRALSKVAILHARLDGYTDNYGTDAYNQQLSLKRADKVADALASGGMPRANLTTRGMGKRDPIADNATQQGRAENRRVAIIIQAP
ncbi:OmpA family protein [Edwardsiella tarda]|uniref:OmpA family protein n=1 Tax=Edwardsiella tarda TaxID=636 RepID=UPI00351BF8E7